MHGYQIKKSLGDRGMRFWFHVEDASIYSALRTLVRLGYAVEEDGDRAARTRPRTVYSLTDSGRAHYDELLRQAIADVPSFAAAIDVVACADGDLDPSDVTRQLAARAERLSERIEELARIARSAPNPSLVDRHRAHLQVELTWTRAQLNPPTTERHPDD